MALLVNRLLKAITDGAKCKVTQWSVGMREMRVTLQ
jgi:hypothetical protein